MPKSFVEALKAKYCDDEDDTSNFVAVSFVFTNRPRKNSGGEGEAELGYLTSMVLSMNGVTHAGIPSEGLTSLCPNVTELDLSRNLIGCWQEVTHILNSLEKLKFVNLSGNRLKDPTNALAKLSDVKYGIESLVLNNTGASWEEIVCLCNSLPKLRELHASQNGYTEIAVPPDALKKCFQNLEVLHLTDNKLASWEQVYPLSYLRSLHTLMLSENPLSNIQYVITSYNEEEEEQMEAGAGHQEMVGEILDSLIEKAFSYTEEPAEEQPSPSHSSVQPLDPSYDSGMEDYQPSTPRPAHKDRLASVGSEDGEPCPLADSGFVVSRQEKCNDNLPEKISCSESQPQTLPDISEHGVNDKKPASPLKGMRRKRSKRKASGSRASKADHSTVEEETPVDVRTDRFAYFEVSWDPEDEAIGHEEDMGKENDYPGSQGKTHRMLEVADEERFDDSRVNFPNLKVLCLTNTQVADWSDLEAIRSFPRLESLRMKGVPFLQNLAQDERRKVLVASLPKIRTLNGSSINEDEKEKSERFFIRHFCGNPSPPSWISDLTKRHGDLKPITEIDLGRNFQEYANLIFVCNGWQIHQDEIHVVQNVVELRKYCAQLVNKPKGSIRMYHLTKNEYTGETEFNLLNQDLLPMSRYDMAHGDEIHIEMVDVRDHFSHVKTTNFSASFCVSNHH